MAVKAAKGQIPMLDTCCACQAARHAASRSLMRRAGEMALEIHGLMRTVGCWL